jgi:sec-independent protein translocase protein TatB
MDIFNIGTAELILIFIIALIVVGPRRLPEIGREIGKILSDLRKMSQEFTMDLTQELEAPAKELREMTQELEAPVKELRQMTQELEAPVKELREMTQEMSAPAKENETAMTNDHPTKDHLTKDHSTNNG